MDVNGQTSFTDAIDLFDKLRAVFFLVSPKPAIPSDQTVDVYANLPSAIDSDGQYWIVDNPSGSFLLLNRRESGIYKAVGGTWVYRGADVPYYLQDDQFTIRDTTDPNKKLGFEVNTISSGQRRIATWQDKNIIVADNVDLQQEITDRQNGDNGTVTIHNDINSAGSGDIITNQERIDINASIGVHNDIDLSGFTETTGDLLKWNGSNYVPCLRKVIRSNTLAINNSTTYLNKINVSIIVQRLNVHKITVSYQWSLNSAASSFVSQATFGGQRLQSALTPSEIHNQEPKDSGGADPDGRGTNQMHAFTGVFYVTPLSLGANQLILSFASSGANNQAAMWGASIEVEELLSII